MQINVKYLRAMLLFVAKNDVRYYLNGVAIQGNRMIATDGNRILVCRLPEDSGLQVIIPTREIKVALMLVEKVFNEFDETIEITTDHIGKVSYKPIEGKYPDFKRLIPKPFEGGMINGLAVNAAYMADYAKIGEIINGKRSYRAVYLKQSTANKNTSILVHIDGCNDFFSLIMPMRIDESTCIPDWLAD